MPILLSQLHMYTMVGLHTYQSLAATDTCQLSTMTPLHHVKDLVSMDSLPRPAPCGHCCPDRDRYPKNNQTRSTLGLRFLFDQLQQRGYDVVHDLLLKFIMEHSRGDLLPNDINFFCCAMVSTSSSPPTVGTTVEAFSSRSSSVSV